MRKLVPHQNLSPAEYFSMTIRSKIWVLIINIELEGVIPAMITPMNKHEAIDKDGIRELTDFLIEAEVNGLCPLGTTGEAFKLDRKEGKEVIETVVDEANNKVTVISGAIGNSTRNVIKFLEEVETLGVDGVLIFPPYPSSLSDEALLTYFRTIAENTDLPIILYNLPTVVGYQISPEVVSKAAEIENIVGIKDSSGKLIYYQQIIDSVPNQFNVIQGYGSLFFQSLCIGGKATICGEPNIAPETLVDLYKSFQQRELEEAKKLHYDLVKILSFAFYGTFPAAIKEAMNMIGLPSGPVRSPATPLTEKQRKKIKKTLKEIGTLQEN